MRRRLTVICARLLAIWREGSGSNQPWRGSSGRSLVGMLSDRIGRKPVLLGLCVGSAALPVTMFSMMASSARSEALAGAVILAMLAGAVSAVGAVATAEQFPGEGRITGLALGATMATAIFGGLTPYAAQLLVERTGWATAPGIMIALVAIAVLPVFLTISETAPTASRSRSGSS